MLKNWVERVVLVADASQGKQKTVYYKPSVAPPQDGQFLTSSFDNENKSR